MEDVDDVEEEGDAEPDPHHRVLEEGTLRGAARRGVGHLEGEFDDGEAEALVVHPPLANQRHHTQHAGPEGGEEARPGQDGDEPDPPGHGARAQVEPLCGTHAVRREPVREVDLQRADIVLRPGEVEGVDEGGDPVADHADPGHGDGDPEEGVDGENLRPLVRGQLRRTRRSSGLRPRSSSSAPSAGMAGTASEIWVEITTISACRTQMPQATVRR